VSQNISRLELALGVRLLARSTRALQLTPEGQAFLEQCKGPLAQLAAACQDAASDVKHASGKLRVTVASPVAFLYLVPLLPTFFKRHPDIQLELELSEDSVALIPKRFDVGIRVGALNDAAFVARPLGPLRILMCASPAYLKLRGKPASPGDLANHALLQLQITGRDQPAPFFVQTREGAARSMQMLQLPGRFVCNDFRALMQACQDGLGIAQLPQPMALTALRKGQLKTVLPDNAPDSWQLFIHYPTRKQLPARVRVFVDFCIEHFAGHPDLSADVSSFSA
jgi:DNA-binding transcriptional LysR family regulator